MARVLAHPASTFVDYRARLRGEPVPGQEVAIVRAAQEARLLALTPRRDGQAGALRLVSRLRLRLLTQRKPDAIEARGVEPREHVRLILLSVSAPRQQETAPMADDPGVVAGRQLRGSCSARKGQELRKAEPAVAARARIRRLSPCVRTHERRNDRPAKLVAQVEGHVRHSEGVAGLAGCDDRFRRAARAIDVRPFGVDPESERDSDRVLACPQQRHRAVHSPAHGHRDAPLGGRGAKDRPERRRKRVHGERIARDRGRLQQRQAGQRLIEPFGVRVDDSVPVHE